MLGTVTNVQFINYAYDQVLIDSFGEGGIGDSLSNPEDTPEMAGVEAREPV
jgi:hypothetical protein